MSGLLLLIFFEIILFCIAFILSGKDIMAPSVMMCIMFVISSLFALFNVDNWNIDFAVDTTLLIFTGIFVFILSEAFYRYFFCGQLHGDKIVVEHYDIGSIYVKSWIINLIIIFDVTICLWYLRDIMSAVGESMANISSYFLAYRRLRTASLKYQGVSLTLGAINQFLKVVSASGYIAAYIFINNYIAGNSKKASQIRYVIIIIISIIPTIMAGGRTGVLKIVSAVLIYYYIIWHQKNGWAKCLSWFYIRVGIISFLIGCIVFYYSLNLLGRTINKPLIDYVSNYLGSSIYLLDIYVKAPIECNSFGEETLIGIKKLLNIVGLGDLSKSYNLEFRTVGQGASNVYTFFRRPFHDFGIIGMYIFTAIVAMFFAWIYYRHIKCKQREKCVGWVLMYGYLYYWIICSSIDQYSQNYVSVGTLIIIGMIIIGYKLITLENKKVRIR